MNAKPTTTKAAAPSTPAAAPAPSPAAGAPGADTGDFATAEILAAAGLPPEDQPATEPEGDDAEAEQLIADGVDPEAAGDEAEGEATEETDADKPADATDDAAAPDEDSPPTDADSDDDAAKPADKTGVQRRIDELTSRAKAAEERATKSEEALAAARAPDPRHLTPSLVDSVDDAAGLAATRAQMLELHSWASTHEHDADAAVFTDAAGKEHTLEPEQIRHLKNNVFQLLFDALPRREAWLRERDQQEAAALAAYPWLKDTTKGDGAAVQQLVLAQRASGARVPPNYRLIAADQQVGAKLRAAGLTVDDALIARLRREQPARKAATAPAKPAQPAAKRPPAAPGAVGSVPTRLDPRTAAQRQSRQALAKSGGGMKDVEQFVEAQLSAA